METERSYHSYGARSQSEERIISPSGDLLRLQYLNSCSFPFVMIQFVFGLVCLFVSDKRQNG